jgi:hypothetical protein
MNADSVTHYSQIQPAGSLAPRGQATKPMAFVARLLGPLWTRAVQHVASQQLATRPQNLPGTKLKNLRAPHTSAHRVANQMHKTPTTDYSKFTDQSPNVFPIRAIRAIRGPRLSAFCIPWRPWHFNPPLTPFPPVQFRFLNRRKQRKPRKPVATMKYLALSNSSATSVPLCSNVFRPQIRAIRGSCLPACCFPLATLAILAVQCSQFLPMSMNSVISVSSVANLPFAPCHLGVRFPIRAIRGGSRLATLAVPTVSCPFRKRPAPPANQAKNAHFPGVFPSLNPKLSTLNPPTTYTSQREIPATPFPLHVRFR